MTNSQRFLDLLEEHGFNFFTGVPCSLFDPATLDRDVESLTRTMRNSSKPVAFVVRKGLLQA